MLSQKNKIGNVIINLLLFLDIILIFTIIFSGGFQIVLGTITIQAHHTRNPFHALVILIILKIWFERNSKKAGIIEYTRRLLEKKYGFWAIISIFLLMASWIKLSQHYTFNTGAYDLAMYDSALSNTLKGQFMYTPWLGRSYFSEHCAPILFGLLPLYLIHDGAYTLMIVQALALVLSLVPLYYIANDTFNDRIVSLGILLAYLNYRYLLNGFMFDFHHEIFEPVLIFSLFFYLRRKRQIPYFIFLILALACKEDMPIYLFVFGLYAGVIEKKWKFGLPTMLISLIWGIVAIKIIIPYSFPDGIHPSRFLDRWSQYGQTYRDIAWGVLSDPSVILGKRFFKNVWKLLFPIGLFPLAKPSVSILAVPPLLLNGTSNFDLQQSFGVHYALPILPFLFIALIRGMKNICNAFPRRQKGLMIIFLYYLLLSNVKFYLLFFESFAISEHDVIGHRLLASLPENVTIAAQTSIIPHLHRSLQVVMLPEYKDSQYIFFDTERLRWPMSNHDYTNLLETFLGDKHYILLSQEQGFYLFKRKEKVQISSQ